MKYCTKCGAQLNDDAAFCISCGSAIATVAAQPESAPQVTAPAPVEEPMPFPADYVAPPPPPAPKRKLGLLLGIGIPAVVVVLVLATVAVFALMNGNPMKQFNEGVTKYFNNFVQLPANEVSGRIQKEDSYDVTATLDLSGISGMVPGAEELPGGASVEFGVKKVKDEAGLRVLAKMGGADLIRAAGVLTKDKLLVGAATSFMGSGDVTSAAMKLKGKPGDTLQERLGSAASGGDTEASRRVQEKVFNAYLKSIDQKCFTSVNDTLTDALTDKPLNVKAVTLTLDSKSAVKLIDAMYDKLKNDDEFFKDLKSVAKGSSGNEETDVKAELEKGIADAKEYLDKEDLNLVVKVYYSGAAPVAVKLDFSLTGEQGGGLKILLQKNTSGDSVGYLLNADVSQLEGSDNVKVDAKLNIRKTKDGYDVTSTINAGSDGESASLDINGKVKIDKVSSEKYNIDSQIDCKMSSAGSDSQDFSLSVAQTVLFGSQVESLRDDKAYMYEDLDKNAEEVDKIEDFYSALSKGLIPSIQ